jgi:hypothetical protein
LNSVACNYILNPLLKVFNLQGKDASKPAGNWFQLLMAPFTKECLPTLSHKQHDFGEKVTEYKLRIFIFSTTFFFLKHLSPVWYLCKQANHIKAQTILMLQIELLISYVPIRFFASSTGKCG